MINNILQKNIFSGFSVSSFFYNFIVESIPKLKIDIKEVSKYTKYEVKPILDKERVSFLKIYKLWSAMQKVSGYSDMGLIVADYLTPSRAGIIGKLFMGTKTLKESVKVMERFLSLMIDNVNFKYEEVEEDALFFFDIVPRFATPQSMAECYIKICYNWVKEYSKIQNISVKEINFYGSSPKHINFYRINFPNTKIHFRQSQNYIVLKKDILYIKNSKKLYKSHDYILKHAQNIKENISSNLSFTQQVVNQILINMPEGECNINVIAKKFNLSISTMKRKLKTDGINFKVLVETIRKELSYSMLKDKRLTYEEISYLLGYSQYSSFFRAFKKWYNFSPSEFSHRTYLCSLTDNIT